MIRRYSELKRLQSFEERYKYLALRGTVCATTFGPNRRINQDFYQSAEWRRIRNYVIVRDNNCDLGILGYEIFLRPIIHHLNPMTADDIIRHEEWVLDPEFLITTTHRTHNAIHYGDERQLPRPLNSRSPGDTKLW